MSEALEVNDYMASAELQGPVPGEARPPVLVAVDGGLQNGHEARPPSESETPPLTPRQLQFVDDYMDLVDKVRRKTFPSGLEPHELEEVTADGLLGLVEAARRNDPDKANKNNPNSEEAFAWQTIKGTMLKGMRQRLGRDGDNIARLKPSVMQGTAISTDQPAFMNNDGEPTEIIEVLVSPTVDDDRVANHAVFYSSIMKYLDGCEEEDRELLLSHIFLGYTQTEIAQKLGVTPAAISKRMRNIYKQLEAKGIVNNPATGKKTAE